MSSDNAISKLRDAIISRKKSANIFKSDERTITITFRVTSNEKQRLEERCEGIVQSDYIRARLFDYPLPRRKVVMSDINREVRYELKRLSVNINQQTKAIDKAIVSGIQPLLKDVKTYIRELKSIAFVIKQIRKQLDESALGVTKHSDTDINE